MADFIKTFDQHFLGQTQEFFERFQFNRRNQESGESIDEYVSVLRNMAKTCGFCDCMRELLIMDRLLLGILDDKTREELLSTHNLTLVKAIESAALEKLRPFTWKHWSVKKSTKSRACQSQRSPPSTRIGNRKESYPAWGTSCKNCGGKRPLSWVTKV